MIDLWELKQWHGAQRTLRGQSEVRERQAKLVDEVPPAPRLNEYLPTPEEIRRACREIQRGWTAAERRRRSGIRDPLGRSARSNGQKSDRR